MGTGIQWTDETWNPVRGCSRVSAGCDHCYAMGQAHRFSGPGKPFDGLTTVRKGKVDWTGRAVFVPSMLDQPLRWKKPRRIFVNSMSDLFHESLSNEEIAAVFGVMAACPRHTFQVLTKRPKRAREWFAWVGELGGIAPYIRAHASDLRGFFDAGMRTETYRGIKSRSSKDAWCQVFNAAAIWSDAPLQNVHLGVSVEDQKTADERIPLLFACPAAVRFISAEPLLGPLDLSGYLRGSETRHVCLDIRGALRNGGVSLDCFTDDNGRALSREEAKQELQRALATGARVLPMGECDDFSDQTGCRGHKRPKLTWVIAGGESGPGARPCALEWLESIVEQCRDAGVPVFVKQLGAFVVSESRACATDEEAFRDFGSKSRWLWRAGLNDRKGGDMADWPEHLRVRQFPITEKAAE